MYNCDSDYGTTVVPFEKSVDVTAFIEEKITEHNYSLADFEVVRGVMVNLKTVKTPIKVLVLTA